MTRMLSGQSELSVASAVFYLSGGIIALLAVTVFRLDGNPLNLANVLTAVSAFAVAALFLILGRRARSAFAIPMLVFAALLVLGFSTLSIDELRFLNSGLLFYTFLIYLVWFGPMWFARVFGYTWLAAYWVVAVWKFGAEMSSLLVTLTVTSALLGELVGLFRRRLETSSLTDDLCGVWNTRGFQLVLPRIIRIMQRSGGPLSALFLDLDDFKRINDISGHAEGDRVLRSFARQVEDASRPRDILARVGGDEFVLLMQDTNAAQAEAVAERLRREVVVTEWSYGIAELQPGEQAGAFIARADRLMLQEKARRKAANPKPHRR